jgi:hypothetical protein
MFMQDPKYCEIYNLQTSFLIQPTKFFTEMQPAFEIYEI